jgi:hypothetical protein
MEERSTTRREMYGYESEIGCVALPHLREERVQPADRVEEMRVVTEDQGRDLDGVKVTARRLRIGGERAATQRGTSSSARTQRGFAYRGVLRGWW